MGMGSDKEAVERILKKEGYKAKFQEAFPDEEDPISYQNLAGAIAAFEETLGTPSRFDKYLAGDLEAINEEEKKGLEAFMDNACTSCHMGPGIGGKMYQKFGLVKGPYWDYTGSELHDRGRAEVTKNDRDEFFFKVPSLRNVTETGPYFHDGSVADLGEAIRIMAITQLGKELSEEEISSIKAFLGSLKGEIPPHALQNEDMSVR
jgi:cytochrome c peroxidase